MCCGSFLVPLTACLLYSFIADYKRDECQENERYQAMLEPSWGIVCLVSTYGLYLLILTSVQCFKSRRAYVRGFKASPDNLSSDEADDNEINEAYRVAHPVENDLDLICR